MSMRTKPAKKNKEIKNQLNPEEVSSKLMDATPLAMIPPTTPEPAPYLPREVIEGIGQGFLQIPSAIVSAALFDNDDLDE